MLRLRFQVQIGRHIQKQPVRDRRARAPGMSKVLTVI